MNMDLTKTTKINSNLCLSKILYKAYKESFSILTYKGLVNFFLSLLWNFLRYYMYIYNMSLSANPHPHYV